VDLPVTLTASRLGRPLYDSIGFNAATPATWWSRSSVRFESHRVRSVRGPSRDDAVELLGARSPCGADARGRERRQGERPVPGYAPWRSVQAGVAVSDRGRAGAAPGPQGSPELRDGAAGARSAPPPAGLAHTRSGRRSHQEPCPYAGPAPPALPRSQGNHMARATGTLRTRTPGASVTSGHEHRGRTPRPATTEPPCGYGSSGSRAANHLAAIFT
jgi:hypothetical protein